MPVKVLATADDAITWVIKTPSEPGAVLASAVRDSKAAGITPTSGTTFEVGKNFRIQVYDSDRIQAIFNEDADQSARAEQLVKGASCSDRGDCVGMVKRTVGQYTRWVELLIFVSAGALIGALMVGVLGGIGLRSRSIYLVLSALTLGPLVLIFMADGRGYEPLVFLFLAGTAIVGLWLGAGLAALTVTCSPRLVPTDSGVRSDAMKRNIDNIPVSKRIPFRH